MRFEGLARVTARASGPVLRSAGEASRLLDEDSCYRDIEENPGVPAFTISRCKQRFQRDGLLRLGSIHSQ